MTFKPTDGVTQRDVIGLVPAGGVGSRVAPLPGSKELFPIGFRTTPEHKGPRPKAVCHYLLEAMETAGVRRICMILRGGKWDLPEYLGDGSELGLDIAYLMINAPFGAPFTIDQAYPWLGTSRVAFGFPDIIFRPRDAYRTLLEQQERTGADVVLGAFPADRPQAVDMVDFDSSGVLRSISIKPKTTSLRYTWSIAVWTPRFSHFLHERVQEHLSGAQHPQESAQLATREWYVGEFITDAVRQGLRVEVEVVSDEPFVDIGTPTSLVAAVRRFAADEPL